MVLCVLASAAIAYVVDVSSVGDDLSDGVTVAGGWDGVSFGIGMTGTVTVVCVVELTGVERSRAVDDVFVVPCPESLSVEVFGGDVGCFVSRGCCVSAADESGASVEASVESSVCVGPDAYEVLISVVVMVETCCLAFLCVWFHDASSADDWTLDSEWSVVSAEGCCEGCVSLFASSSGILGCVLIVVVVVDACSDWFPDELAASDVSVGVSGSAFVVL